MRACHQRQWLHGRQGPGDVRRQGPSAEVMRIFVGVPLPEDLLPMVERVQDKVRDIPGIRLMRAEQLHVTLAFIGEVGADKMRAAAQVVQEIPPALGGVVPLGGIVALPSASRARVVAIELDDSARVMQRLFEMVMSALESRGVMQREKRPFRAHLTIARLRAPAAVQPKYQCEPVGFEVSSVCLYRSQLLRSGAVYTVVKRQTLEVAQ